MSSGDVLAGLETPVVVLDRDRLQANIVAMQDLADASGVALRPHAKTHKSIEIGHRQIAAGAVGLTVATVDEALTFIAAGCPSITLSRPLLDGEALERLLAGRRRHDSELRLVIDSETGVNIASAACSGILGVFIKIDVGLHRCGVDAGSTALLDLARRISRKTDLDFRGILSHAGQAYAATSQQEASAIADAERDTMNRVCQLLTNDGIAVPEISVGATPTVLAASNFEGITEIRPGNYVFLDLLPIKVGVAAETDVALSVLATVISKNNDFFVTDAGSKTLTSDTGGHGLGQATGFGRAYPCDRYLDPDSVMVVESLSEEHGKLRRKNFDLALGSRVRIIPNHSCPVANLASRYAVAKDDELSFWPVDARSGLY